MTRVALVASALLAVLAAGAAAYWRTDASAGRVPASGRLDDSLARAPEGVRIRVEVLNAKKTRGLAKRMTRHLRDNGFDVVDMGTERTQRDSTLVLDRSGHPDWARRVAKALGGVPVESRPDSSRYLDVTVLIGVSWRPPPEPFHP